MDFDVEVQNIELQRREVFESIIALDSKIVRFRRYQRGMGDAWSDYVDEENKLHAERRGLEEKQSLLRKALNRLGVTPLPRLDPRLKEYEKRGATQ